VSIFLDTSVLVAAVRTADERFTASNRLIKTCTPEKAACAAHTLAEVYATLTGMRPPNRFRPDQAMLLLDGFRAKLNCVVLTADEVQEAARRVSRLGLAGGVIYDALLLACARKVDAERIYTWNERHFKLVAPDLAGRIVEP
jgi:predicted nucleic acid-binding protein